MSPFRYLTARGRGAVQKRIDAGNCNGPQHIDLLFYRHSMKLRDWSLRRWAVVIALIFLLPLIGLRLHLKWRVHHAVAELREQGLPTTWDEANRQYAVVPPEQNIGPRLTNLFQNLPFPSALLRSNIPIVGFAPTPKAGEPWPDLMRSASGEYLAGIRENLDKLYGVIDEGLCRYPGELGPLPWTHSGIWSAGSKISLDSRHALEVGEYPRSARANRALFKLADTLYAEPAWIGQLVRCAITSVAVIDCQHLLSLDACEGPELTSLQQAIRNSSSQSSLRHVIDGERVSFLESIDPDNGFIPLDFNIDYQPDTHGEYWERLKVLLYRMTGLADQDVLWFLQNSRKLQVQLGDKLASHQSALAAWTNFTPEGAGLRFTYWSKQHVAVDDRTIGKHLELHKKLRAADAALAVAQYRLQHDGKLPASLDELVPEYLEAVPVEPQSDKPFELIVTTDGYGIGRGTPVFTVKLKSDPNANPK